MKKIRKRYFFAVFSVLVFLLALFLRLYSIDKNPPGLYIDEVSIGYNAYSILRVGKDEFGGNYPLWFKAFGEYKLPVYIYLTSVSEALFGKNINSVRFPSVISGFLTIVFFILFLYFLTKKSIFSLLGGFILCISPWHIQFSRAAFEANTGLLLFLLGVLMFILGIQKRNYLIFLSILFFILTLYTYNVYRIFTPLYFLFLIILYRKTIFGNFLFKAKSLVVLGLLIVLVVPFIRFSVSKEGLVRARSEMFVRHVEAKPEDFFQNITFLQINQYMKNYLSYFSLDLHFFHGDQTGRHSVREMGMNHIWQMPFILYGIYIGLKRKERKDKMFLCWFLTGAIAPSFVDPNPHALRALVLVIPISYFTVLGLFEFFKIIKNYYFIVSIAFILVFQYFLFSYLHIYHVHYPKKTAPDWYSGYKELVEFLEKEKDKYKKVIVTDRFEKGYLYLAFYSDLDARDYLREANPMTNVGKYQFINSPYTKKLDSEYLYAAPSWEERDENLLKTIYDRGGSEVFKVWEN